MVEQPEVDAVRHRLADAEAALEGAAARDREALEATRDALIDELARMLDPEPVIVDGEAEELGAAGAADYTGGTELVVSAGGEDLWQVLDAHDEALVLAELQQRALPTLLYDFEGAGHTRMVDLSIYGVRECARLLNATGKLRIGVDPQSLRMGVDTVDGVQYVTAQVFAREEVTGYGEFGIAREPRHMVIRKSTAMKYKGEGKGVFESLPPGASEPVYRTYDPHAEKKALAKATRNALRTMIPERMRQQMIAMKRGDESLLKVISRGAGATADAALPAPAVSERAQEALTSIAEAWQQIRLLAIEQGRAMPPMMPGQYGNRLRHASHSEELLEALLGELEAMLTAMREGKV